VYGGPLSVGGTNGYEGNGFKKAYNAGINWVHIFWGIRGFQWAQGVSWRG
jgi:hypothetical protein